MRTPENIVNDIQYWLKIRDVIVNSPMYYGTPETGAITDLTIEKLKSLEKEMRNSTGMASFSFTDVSYEKPAIQEQPRNWHQPTTTQEEPDMLLLHASAAFEEYQKELEETRKEKRHEYLQDATNFFRSHIGNYLFTFGDNDLISCGDITLKFYQHRGQDFEAHLTLIKQCDICNTPFEDDSLWIHNIHQIGLVLNDEKILCPTCLRAKEYKQYEKKPAPPIPHIPEPETVI